jgi:hypothetical protein
MKACHKKRRDWSDSVALLERANHHQPMPGVQYYMTIESGRTKVTTISCIIMVPAWARVRAGSSMDSSSWRVTIVRC